MASTFDDEELSMSLSTPAQDRRPHRPPPPKPNHASPHAQDPVSRQPGDRRTAQRIGLYDVKRTLGEGSFGKVKLATHQVTKQEVALKIISRKKLISRDMAGRVEREIQYLQLLRHPHIIKLYTVITTPAEIIMVLEYAGGELFDYLVKHGKMSENKARRFFQQIVCAVEYCHRHKIVHRDLKPENLLLDGDLNVKIADFGLSNIMTDGNFLKTSCGSPNYAAPEVISGKLYAGPEVDVWSCGVILYVLLVGRLPFDDEFIPALFKKISAGTYSTPPWVSSGAKHIIHRMLKVNPVQRITIQEIRQDPWFNENLEEYLKQPVEDFIDTGVDPNKAIDPRQLAPGKPAEVQEKIHDSVIGKLGKTMGYAKDDVQDALGKDEPNAIKDAYLIVRENQIMQTNPHLAHANPFMAMSPPTYGSNTPRPFSSPLAEAASERVDQLSAASNMQQMRDAQIQSSTPPRETMTTSTPRKASLGAKGPEEVEKEYVSKIGILTSSLPVYHNAFMAAKKKDQHFRRLEEQGEPLEPRESVQLSTMTLNVPSGEQSSEEQAETLRRLKPHSRSTMQLQSITANAQYEELGLQDSRTKPRHKTTKWQFGIRCPNQPVDAITCLYKALDSMPNCQWHVNPRKKRKSSQGSNHDGPFPVSVQGATHLQSKLSESPEKSKHDDRGRADYHPEPARDSRNGSPNRGNTFHMDYDDDSESENDEDVDPELRPENYAPKDPWCINVRWEKKDMAPPGAATSNSARSSRIDLNSSDGQGRRRSVLGSLASTTGSTTSVLGSGSVLSADGSTMDSSGPGANMDGTACFVYMDLQIYLLESSNYLVDFKSAGYETIAGERQVRDRKGGVVTESIGSGVRKLDKDVTSPQPFMDFATELVIHLAKPGK